MAQGKRPDLLLSHVWCSPRNAPLYAMFERFPVQLFVESRDYGQEITGSFL